jgi:hypothetical protein
MTDAHQKTEIANRRREVAEKYLRGATIVQIAEEYGLDKAQISRDLKYIREQWLEASINHIDQKKATELAKLDHLEMTYWDGWERSIKSTKIETSEETPVGHRKTRQTKTTSGNPSFLDGVLKCIEKRCQILGIDAAKKITVDVEVNNVRNRIMAALAGDVAESHPQETPENIS